jgi:hypothetical protein
VIEMAENAQDFEIGLTDGGLWYAASCVSPCFYFEDPSKDEVLGLVQRALNFHFDAPGSFRAIAAKQVIQKPTLTRAHRKQTVGRGELAIAC